MSTLEQGIWACTVVSANSGEDDRGSPQVQINVTIDDGPSKGRQCTYEDQVNAKSALYISRSCTAVGWAGKSLSTLKTDVAAWIAKTGGKTTVEIKHIELKRGKKYDKWVEGGCNGSPPIWDKASSIGRGTRVLAPMSAANAKDADDAMREAMAADGGAPGYDEPPSNGSPDTSDIPF